MSSIQFGPHGWSNLGRRLDNSNVPGLKVTPDGSQVVDPFASANTVFVPSALYSQVELWVWDWDDTLIDTAAYSRHPMDRDYILKMPDAELNRDWPHWRYFRDLCTELVTSGKRVGIASFGTYSIIQAYMTRVFGPGQQVFTGANIMAAARSIGERRVLSEMPLNKNPYIQRLMNLYRITDHDRVFLFDDLPSNVGDALAMGVRAYLIPMSTDPVTSAPKLADNRMIKVLDAGKPRLTNEQIDARRDRMTLLFGEQTMYDIEAGFRDACGQREAIFGQVGERKYWKQREQVRQDGMRRRLTPERGVGSLNPVLDYLGKLRESPMDEAKRIGAGYDEMAARGSSQAPTTTTVSEGFTGSQNKQNNIVGSSNKGGTKCLSSIQGCEFELTGNSKMDYESEVNKESWYRCASGEASNGGMCSDGTMPYRCDDKTGKCELVEKGNHVEGFAGCMSCKSPTANWMIGLLLLILVALIWWCCYRGVGN